MWEKDRCDGKRKLKCNAVPTIFSHSISYNFPASSENNNRDNSVVNMLIASLTDEGEIKIDHQYQLHSNNIERLKNQQPEDHQNNTFASANVEEGIDWKKRYEELMSRLTKSESECERLRGVMKKREDLFNRLIKKSYNCGKVLKERLKKLRKENQLNDKLNIRLREIFNEDQLKAFTSPAKSCKEWSYETIKRAIRLRLACGSVGYQEILDQQIPLPSERIVQEKMDSIELDI